MDEPDGTAEQGPTRRVTDLVLVALLLVFTAASIGFAALPPAQALGGMAVTVVTLASIPLRRSRPRTALAVLAVPTAVGYVLQLPTQALTWAVLAFALVRSPYRAAGWLMVATTGVSAVAGAGFATVFGRGLAEGIGYGLSLWLQIGFLALVGAVLGLVSRAVRAREETRRRSEERARTAAALAAQRTRIADELGSGVLDGLRRLTGRTAALDPGADPAPGDRTGAADGTDAVALLERDARAVLTRMRRTLAALRGQDGTPGGEPAPAAGGRPDPSRPSGPPWFPTRRGLALSAAFGLSALGVGLLPLRPIGAPTVDRMIAMFDLPWGVPLALVSLTVQVLAVAWWRSAPVAAFLVATAAAVVTSSLGATNGIIETSWMVLVYCVAVGAAPRRSGPVVAAGSLAVLVAYLTLPAVSAQVDGGAVGNVLAYLVVPFLWFAGVRRRAHRRHTEALAERRHEAERAQELEAQRLRVARDLHDVVAHHVSAIAVQAGAARVTTDPALRREALEHIAESGRRVADALPELTDLTPDAGGVALTADGVADLLRPVRDAGLPVSCEVRGEPVAEQGDPELFAQRILTEALTNVVRHAGNSATRVLLDHRSDDVVVEIVDAGPVAGHRPQGLGSGLGVVGMRERAHTLGGRVDAGPAEGGGWRVRALLPRAGVLREEEGTPSISSSATTRAVPEPA